MRLIKPRGASLLSIWQAGPPQRGVHRQPFGPNPAPDEVNTFTPWTWRDFLNSQQMARSDRTRTRAADRTKHCPHAEPSARQQPCPSTSSMAPSNAPHEMLELQGLGLKARAVALRQNTLAEASVQMVPAANRGGTISCT